MASESLGCDTFEWNPVKPYYFSPFGELQLLGWFFWSRFPIHSVLSVVRKIRLKPPGGIFECWLSRAGAELGDGTMGIPNPRTFAMSHSGVLWFKRFLQEHRKGKY